jgi:hypothetical protein
MVLQCNYAAFARQNAVILGAKTMFFVEKIGLAAKRGNGNHWLSTHYKQNDFNATFYKIRRNVRPDSKSRGTTKTNM